MELREYKNLAEREHFFWWNVGRRRILKEALSLLIAWLTIEKYMMRFFSLPCGSSLLVVSKKKE
ncbi:MAG: hypothetical protein Q8R36_01200 [bacterium]|nr:hypothetical protein [bacterium]